MKNSWKDIRKQLNITSEEEQEIALEKDIIKALVSARESKNLTQKELAKLCGVSQSSIARLENSTHSPQLNNLLRILRPLGYTLQIIPIEK